MRRSIRLLWVGLILGIFGVGMLAPQGTDPGELPAGKEAKPTTRPARKDIGVDAFAELMEREKHIILDVRTAKEYSEGHIPGAVNIDVNEPGFEEKVGALKKDQAYLVHCRSGVRSVRACDKLLALGFEELYNLEGGIVAWEKAGKKVAK